MIVHNCGIHSTAHNHPCYRHRSDVTQSHSNKLNVLCVYSKLGKLHATVKATRLRPRAEASLSIGVPHPVIYNAKRRLTEVGRIDQ